MSHFVSKRDVVTVTGSEAQSYLQGQISQDVDALGIGDSAWSLILQPQGKVDAWFRITKSGDETFLLDVDEGHGETLLARLKRFKLRTKADLELATWDWCAIREHDEPENAPDTPIAATPAGGQVGLDLLAPELPEPLSASMTEDEFERLRILAGVPAMGSELDEGTIPAEARVVDDSVSFTKGCYTGQELVARVDSRGDNTPRKLRIISGSGSAASVGAELSLDGSVAGVITSVASDGDGWVALAYIKRSALEASSLFIDGQSVDVRPVPADVEVSS